MKESNGGSGAEVIQASEPDPKTPGNVPDSTLDLLIEDEPEDGSPLIGRLCVLALGAVAGSAVFASYVLGIGSLTNPGPGLWPFSISLITFVLTIVLLILGCQWSATPQGGRKWVLTAVVGIVVYCLILPVLGFIFATIPLVFFFMRIVGGSGWISTIVTAILAPLGSYYVFDVLLGVPLFGPTLW
ncbi:MAG: tripartite tricarboxylate transporter TctB family protein [Micrococcaceae bacterium]